MLEISVLLQYLWAQQHISYIRIWSSPHFYFENISLQPKLNNILTSENLSKMWILSENRRLKIFVEIYTLVEYSRHCQNFFLGPKLTFKHFYFLNHVNSTKIEKISTLHTPPPKTHILGGVWHVKWLRFRVCLQTKKFFWLERWRKILLPKSNALKWNILSCGDLWWWAKNFA